MTSVQTIRIGAAKITGSGRIWYEAEPLLLWLDRLVREARALEYDWNMTGGLKTDMSEMTPEQRVALRCGITTDHLQKLRKRRTMWLEEPVVDRMISSEGSTHIGAIYRDYWRLASKEAA